MISGIPFACATLVPQKRFIVLFILLLLQLGMAPLVLFSPEEVPPSDSTSSLRIHRGILALIPILELQIDSLPQTIPDQAKAKFLVVEEKPDKK